MNKVIFGSIVALACVPLLSCNQQQGSKTPAVHQTERRGEREDFGGGERERGRGHGLRRACSTELEKYCAGKDRGRARRECLESHMDELSTDCKAAIEERGKGRRRRDDF